MSTPTKQPDGAPAAAAEADAPAERGARKRFGYLLRHSKLWLVALLLLLLAAAVAAGSLAVFSSSSANPNNQFTAGNLTHSNSKNGSAILTATNMVPGDSSTGEVVITNTGDVSGVFTLSTSNLVDTPPSPPFSNKLDLRIEDFGGAADTNGTPVSTVYTGKLNGVGTKQLGTWAKGASHRYKFTVTFPNGTAADDNQYKGAQTKIQFDWTATSS